MSNGAPSGRLCLQDHIARQALVDARMAARRRASPAGQLERIAVRALELQQRASALGPDADAAVRLGAHVLNQHAERVADQLGAAVENVDDPFHREALELVLTRSLPMSVINAAAVRLARSGELGERSKRKAGPRFVLNVGLTHGPHDPEKK